MSLKGVPFLYLISKLETHPHSCGRYTAFCTNNPYRQDLQSITDIAELTVQKATADAWSELEPDTDIRILATIEDAVNNAREVAKDSNIFRVLVVGSLHLVGGFLGVLNGHSA